VSGPRLGDRFAAHPWVGLALGVLCCSTAVIFIKASATPPIWLAAERVLLAALCTAPLAWRDVRRSGGRDAVSWRAALWPGCFLAAHFAAWVVAARLIPAANSTLLANFTPVIMPLVAWVMLRHRVSGPELLATVVGVAGVGALAVGDLDASRSFLIGDGLCLFAMVSLAVYLALARHLRRGSLWAYMAPLFTVAGAILVVAALLIEGLPPLPSAGEAVLVVGLAVVPTVIGHSMMNRAICELRPQVVSLVGLGNVPSAALMAWLLWSERPSAHLWVAVAAFLASIILLGWRPRAACVPRVAEGT